MEPFFTFSCAPGYHQCGTGPIGAFCELSGKWWTFGNCISDSKPCSESEAVYPSIYGSRGSGQPNNVATTTTREVSDWRWVLQAVVPHAPNWAPDEDAALTVALRNRLAAATIATATDQNVTLQARSAVSYNGGAAMLITAEATGFSSRSAASAMCQPLREVFKNLPYSAVSVDNCGEPTLPCATGSHAMSAPATQSCSVINCGDLSLPTGYGGLVRPSSNSYGSSAVLACAAGYKQCGTGPVGALCDLRGKWWIFGNCILSSATCSNPGDASIAGPITSSIG